VSALTLAKVFEAARRLPSLPAVVAELLRETQTDDVGTDELARKIPKDQGLRNFPICHREFPDALPGAYDDI
jgi:HD-like signal output (HDOD) protein